VGERPVDRQLSDLAVVPGDIGAAAVVEVPADRVVVIAEDRRNRTRRDERADLVRSRAVADEVAAAVDRVDAESVDRGERR
jgi:hypothetical protein